MHDLYIVEVYRPGAVFWPLIVYTTLRPTSDNSVILSIKILLVY